MSAMVSLKTRFLMANHSLSESGMERYRRLKRERFDGEGGGRRAPNKA